MMSTKRPSMPVGSREIKPTHEELRYASYRAWCESRNIPPMTWENWWKVSAGISDFNNLQRER